MKTAILSAALTAASFASISLPASIAHAACLSPADPNDVLSPDDLAVARQLFEFELAMRTGTVGASPCNQEYAITHVTIGGRQQVLVTGPEGGSRYTFGFVEDLPEIYANALDSLAAEHAATEAEESNDMESINDGAPGIESVLHVRFIGGMHFNADQQDELDPGFGFGYRFISGRTALDVSAFNLTFDDGTPSGDWLRFMPMIYFVKPDRVQAMQGFAGVGLAYSTVSYEGGNGDLTADGVEVDFALGWTFMEHLPVVPFIQLEGGLPVFQVRQFEEDDDPTNDRTAWTPNVSVSLGFAFDL